MKNTEPEPQMFSQEENDRLCTGMIYNPWTHLRTACPHEAVALFPDTYVNVKPLRFCRYHWHDFRAQVTDEVREGGLLDFVGEYVARHLMWDVLASERQRVREELRREQDELQAHARELRRLKEEQRRLNRDSLALSSELTEGSRVYFIQAGKRGPIKIGKANDVLKRLDELQTGNPQRLRVRVTVPGGIETEHEYHRMFAEHRMSGEWFRPAEPILREIRELNRIGRRSAAALF